ncbi:DUF4861 domain-containing protein [Pontibacter beigongshangensis]|uniref:DUF4861 domain-containing protein n=1 Tax=Pontibacter beigongshangensis TaxID=2574733 RepID=UPI00165024E2|nr:DUF4861 domain-containing protein [Pontibacter beigongshangensis]
MPLNQINRAAAWAVVLLFAATFSSCQQNLYSQKFTVSNNLGIERKTETVSIPIAKVRKLAEKYGAENLLVKDAATDAVLVSQALDSNADGTIDEILFQTNMEPNGKKDFIVRALEKAAAQRPESKLSTYSRFVPERTDDYTWENDRVAFRTYGPVAQQMVERKEPGGTLTSGIDAWLKRVDYPIINKWYQNHADKPGAYHIDSGEGYDPYHVGDSRGIGGIGVWENDRLHVSKNFVSYKSIAEGPIRTVFELTYAPWQANGRTITETKRISLDLGSNLSRYEVTLQSNQPLPNATIGITLHDQKGEVKTDQEQGWFRYWEPMDDSELGTGLVVDPAVVQVYKEHRVHTRDQSHLYVLTTPKHNSITYYPGFGWKKSGQFTSKADWDAYLADFAKRLASPLEVKF